MAILMLSPNTLFTVICQHDYGYRVYSGLYRTWKEAIAAGGTHETITELFFRADDGIEKFYRSFQQMKTRTRLGLARTVELSVDDPKETILVGLFPVINKQMFELAANQDGIIRSLIFDHETLEKCLVPLSE